MSGDTITNSVSLIQPCYSVVKNWNGRWIVADNVAKEAIATYDSLEEAESHAKELNEGDDL